MQPIQVRRYGTAGNPVVVLHGGPGAPGSSAGLARALASGFCVLEPLQRRSGTVALTVARHVEDLSEVMRTRCALVGHSWGAMLALSFTAHHPDRVSRLALVGCGTYDTASRDKMHTSLDELLDETARVRIAALREQLRAEREPRLRDSILKELAAVFMTVESYELIPEEEIEVMGDALSPDADGNKETWKDVLRLQREGREPQIFTKIRCPVLMLHGALDPHPGDMTRALLRQFIPHVEYMEFRKCGHEPWRERHAREPFLSALRTWLGGSEVRS